MATNVALRVLQSLRDRSAPWLTSVVAVLPLAVVVAIGIILLCQSLPALRINGTGFLTHDTWSVGNEYANPIHTRGVERPLGASYGALPLIVGTLESSLIALVLAVPVALGAAVVVVEKLPPRVSRAVGTVLEVLVGIPSVVYGLWGVLTLGPFLSRHMAGIARHVPDVPVLRFFRGPTGNGEGLLTSGVILAVMIVPIIAATARDIFRQVPAEAKEGAQALGMTDAEVVRKVVWPWSRTGIVGASVLGLGRALGETIAVAMASGSVLGSSAHSLYSNMNTIAATIVTQLDSAGTDGTGFAVKVLAELGFVLMVITLVTNLGARWILRRVSGPMLPVARPA